MTEHEKAVVSDLRRNAKKLGVWSPGRDDMLAAADLIEELCAERDRLAEQVQELEKASADVQEVTRCRDCIHFATDKPTEVFGLCLLHKLMPTIDGLYCAWATRKNGKRDA